MKTFAALLCFAALQDGVSPDLLEYEPAGELRGEFVLGPGEGYERLLERWAARLKEQHPDLRGGLAASKSDPTAKAMAAGVSRFGLMTRPWTDDELDEFRIHFGYLPKSIVVGGDALRIVVHPDNPLLALSLEELDAVFSATRRRGGKERRAWGELGLDGDWKQLPIRAYGLAKDARLRPALQSRALLGGKFREDVRELADVASLLSAVAEDPCAIGYVGGAGGSDQVRVVPLRPAADQPAVPPDRESILSLSYPLAWRISLSLRKHPKKAVDPDLGEFAKLILSRDGQVIAADEGLVPVTGRFARKELLKLK